MLFDGRRAAVTCVICSMCGQIISSITLNLIFSFQSKHLQSLIPRALPLGSSISMQLALWTCPQARLLGESELENEVGVSRLRIQRTMVTSSIPLITLRPQFLGRNIRSSFPDFPVVFPLFGQLSGIPLNPHCTLQADSTHDGFSQPTDFSLDRTVAAYLTDPPTGDLAPHLLLHRRSHLPLAHMPPRLPRRARRLRLALSQPLDPFPYHIDTLRSLPALRRLLALFTRWSRSVLHPHTTTLGQLRYGAKAVLRRCDVVVCSNCALH